MTNLNLTALEYDGCVNSYGEYTDFEFGEGDCRLYRVTHCATDGRWYGGVRNAADEDAEFDDGEALSADVVAQLVALIPTEDRPNA